MAVRWMYFPMNESIPPALKEVVDAFDSCHDSFDSEDHGLASDKVLDRVSGSLESIGFTVEHGKAREDLIRRPVLFSENGRYEKCFDVDAYREDERIAIEVEAGRAYTNHQFLKDFFETCMMIDVEYLCIAVRNTYITRVKGTQRVSRDFDRVCTFFKTMYVSNRIRTDLRGLLVIGY